MDVHNKRIIKLSYLTPGHYGATIARAIVTRPPKTPNEWRYSLVG